MSDCARVVVLIDSSDGIDNGADGDSRGSKGTGVRRLAPFCQEEAALCDR